MPFGENAKCLILFSCPVSVERRLPSLTSQSRIVWSKPPVARTLLSEENAKVRIGSVCPTTVKRKRPVRLSQNRTALSHPTDAKVVLSGESLIF